MRLLTHNFLACLQCETFPLTLTAQDVEVIPVAYDAEFTRRMLTRISYAFLVSAFRELKAAHEDALVAGASAAAEAMATEPSENEDGAEAEGPFFKKGDDVPDTLEGADLTDGSATLRLLHFALNMVAVRNGEIKCSACGQTYTVNDFIPNFVIEGKK